MLVQAFNRGDYQDSVEAKRKADAIVSVLYPNDATPEGKLLRLEQQYFFVSASIQVCVSWATACTRMCFCTSSVWAKRPASNPVPTPSGSEPGCV